MDTRIDEIEDGFFRLSTSFSRTTRTVNQFLIDAEEPLLFHAGTRSSFPTAVAAIGRVMPVQRLRWLSFSHLEADEMGAMNDWLGLVPQLTVVHSPLGCETSLADLAQRPPLALGEGDRLELGGRQVRVLSTPDLPHNPEAVMVFEEVTATLCCSDLGSNDASASMTNDLALAVEEPRPPFPGMTTLTRRTPATLRRLAGLTPRTLAVMHGASFRGEVAGLLGDFAARCDQLLARSEDEMGHLADGSFVSIPHDANDRQPTDTEESP